MSNDSKKASDETANEDNSKISESKWLLYEKADKNKNEKEEAASVKTFGETCFKSDEKDQKEVNLTLCEPGKGRDCQTPEQNWGKEEHIQSSKRENIIDCLRKADSGDDPDQKSNSSEESSVKVQKNEDTEQEMDVMKMKREQEEDHSINQDSK